MNSGKIIVILNGTPFYYLERLSEPKGSQKGPGAHGVSDKNIREQEEET